MSTLSLQRSKKLLEAQGFHVGILEHWNQWAHIRQDFLQLADLGAIHPDHNGTTYVQACGEDVSSHVAKLLCGYTDAKGKIWPPNPHLSPLLRSGNKFFIWAWRLRGSQGKRKTYQLRQIEFVLKDGLPVPYEIPEAPEGTE
jgi:hypothetical protein